MFPSLQARRGTDDETAVDIAPLIDVVFILLIFFLVSSTFLQDTGVEVQRAEAATATASESLSLRLSITAAGNVYTGGEQVDLGELGRRVAQGKARGDVLSVLIIPDREASSGRLVEVMDVIRAAGIQQIAIAAEARR